MNLKLHGTKAFYLFAFIIYIIIAKNSYGFDDEFFNILVYERFGIESYKFTQVYDTHPPGSYFLNGLLYQTLGSWSNVRVFSAIINITLIIFLTEYISKKFSKRSGLIFFILTAFNPAFLLWATSIRWYAYLMTILLWMLMIPKNEGFYYWFKFCLGIFLMAYFGYIAFILAIPLFYMYFQKDSRNIKLKLSHLSVFSLIFFILYLPQMINLFENSITNNSNHSFNFLKIIIGIYSSQISNQGIFPFSIYSFISFLGFSLIIISIINSTEFSFKGYKYFLPYLILNLLMIITSLASKIRNHLFLIPFQSFWIGTAFINKKNKKKFILGMIMFTFINFVGIYNVLVHKNTTKNSWNIPMDELIYFVDDQNKNCNGDIAFFTYDPVIAWNLYKVDKNTYSPFNYHKNNKLNKKYECLVVFDSYGGISKIRKNELKDLIIFEKDNGQKIIATDKYYKLKQFLNPDYSENVLTASLYRGFHVNQDVYDWLASFCSSSDEGLFCNF